MSTVQISRGRLLSRGDIAPAGHQASTVRVCFSLEEAEPFYAALEATGVATAFQTLLWIKLWRRELALARGATLLCVLVSEPSGKPLALIPLCRRRVGLLLVIEAADLGVCDYVAPVLAEHFRPSSAEWRAIWSQVRAALPRHDLLRLTKVPREVHGRPNPLAGLEGARPISLEAFGLPISIPWKACAGTVLSRHARQNIGRKGRRIAEQGDVRFRVAEKTEEAEQLFDTLVAQRIARFRSLGRREPLEDPAFRAFYDAVVREGTPAGFVRLAALDVGGKVVAAVLGLVQGGAYHVILPAFAGEPWSRFSPGLLLMARTMEWAAENGLTYFDFTIGNERYKQDLGGRPRELVAIVQAGSALGLPHAIFTRLKPWLKQQAWFPATLAGRSARAAGPDAPFASDTRK